MGEGTIYPILSRFKKEGLVETEKKGFRIPDPAALAALSPED